MRDRSILTKNQPSKPESGGKSGGNLSGSASNEKGLAQIKRETFVLYGAPGEIRTPDPLVRSPTGHLYVFIFQQVTELAHAIFSLGER